MSSSTELVKDSIDYLIQVADRKCGHRNAEYLACCILVLTLRWSCSLHRHVVVVKTELPQLYRHLSWYFPSDAEYRSKSKSQNDHGQGLEKDKVKSRKVLHALVIHWRGHFDTNDEEQTVRCEGSRPNAEYSHQTSAGRSENCVLERPCEVNVAVKYEKTQVQGRGCSEERKQAVLRFIWQQVSVVEVVYQDVTRTSSQVSNRQWEDYPVGGVMKLPLRDDQERNESIARDDGERYGNAKKPVPPRYHPQILTTGSSCVLSSVRTAQLTSFVVGEHLPNIRVPLRTGASKCCVYRWPYWCAAWLLFSPTMLAGAAFVHAFQPNQPSPGIGGKLHPSRPPFKTTSSPLRLFPPLMKQPGREVALLTEAQPRETGKRPTISSPVGKGKFGTRAKQ